MQTSSRRWLWFFALILLAITGGTIYVASKTPPSLFLLQRATRITNLETNWYLWRSPNQLLLTRQQPGTQDILHLYAAQLDCATGRTTLISAVTRDISRVVHWQRGDVSPNGRWLLIPGYDHFEAVELNTNRVIATAPQKLALSEFAVLNTLWLPDSRHWVSLVLDMGRNSFCAVEQSLNSSHNIRGPSFGYPQASTLFPDSAGSRLLGFVGADRVLALPLFSLEWSKSTGKLLLYEFSVGRSPKLRQYSLAVPEGGHVLDAALSPGGDRLALLVRRIVLPTPSPLRRLLSRWLPSMRTVPHPAVELYTVRPDGKDRHLLGYLPSDKSDEDTIVSDDMTSHYRLGWLPDSKRLSFIHKNALWTIPSQ
jgi:hypothetical protein